MRAHFVASRFAAPGAARRCAAANLCAIQPVNFTRGIC